MDAITGSDELASILQALTGRQWEGFDPSQFEDTGKYGSSTAMSSAENSEPLEGSDSEHESTGSADNSGDGGGNGNLSKTCHADKNHTASGKAAAHMDRAGPQSLSALRDHPGLKIGEMATSDTLFAPWKLVKSYPDLFVGKANAVKITPWFTLESLHKERIWDLYYLYDPGRPNQDPILFVPGHQFQHLLSALNAKFGMSLAIPGGPNEQKFNMKFPRTGTPRPRFLGRSKSADDFLDMTEDFPEPEDVDDVDKMSAEDRDKFMQMINSIFRSEKNAKKAEKSRIKRIKLHIAWGRSMKRTQRYLGLREREGQEVQTALDLSKPTTLAPEGHVLFIAIDLEAYEFNQDLITEIGLAMLDTDKLAGVAPGEGGKNWFSLIEARHIRVKENTWAQNYKHVQGWPDRFNFGTSEFVPQGDLARLLERVIDGATRKENGTTVQRTVVLVFHESLADIKFLKAIHYNPYFALNVSEMVDTRELNQYNTRNNNQTSLERVLNRLQIPHSFLHNAGNDAVYTLQSMISLAVERRVKGLEKRAKKDKSPIHRGESEGWTSGEDSDGGEPVRSFPEQKASPDNYYSWNS